MLAERIGGVIAPSPPGAGCRGWRPRSDSLTVTRVPKNPPGHFRPLLQNCVDRLRIERPLRNRAPAPDPTKHAALVDVCRSRPRVECLDWPAGEIDDIVRLAARRFRPAEMDGE
jgi:hypothetical protein